MTLREKAEAAADMAFPDVSEQHKQLADAIEQVAREFAEAAVRRYALFRQTTYEDTPEQLIVSALKDTEKRIK